MTFTQRGQLGLFLPVDFKPAPQRWAQCPQAVRQRLAELRAEFAELAAQRAKAAARGRMRY